ncbi:hypothetical protein, partial [Cryobacterium melibiosiphilum]|uniref:hypothetical protein n=1 Tax=Cryobacterium melibiosiphilum TaxID=995039 RepID=UPI001F2B00D0
TTPVVGLNGAGHASEQWGSTAPQVVPIEANIHRVRRPSVEGSKPVAEIKSRRNTAIAVFDRALIARDGRMSGEAADS